VAALATEIADTLADLTLKSRRRPTDAEADTILQRAAERLCENMLNHGASSTVAEATLNAMAQAFEVRLQTLDAAAVQVPGHV
jgi:uncharacterized membrane protein YjjP (DUF1212 family)